MRLYSAFFLIEKVVVIFFFFFFFFFFLFDQITVLTLRIRKDRLEQTVWPQIRRRKTREHIFITTFMKYIHF